MSAQTVIGIDVSRDWLDGFCLPEKQRFRFQNSPDGHARLLETLQSMPDGLKIGFEATGGQEWALWRLLISMGHNAVQLPPAQIKAFALSMGKRAKTDQIDAELIARFMAFRPEAGRTLPDVKLQFLRALTVRRAQMVEARKRLSAQISARRKQGVSAELEDMDSSLKEFLESQISELEQRIESVIAEAEELSAKAELLRSIPGIGPVSVSMLLAEMPELGRMTATEAAAMAGLAPMAHDSGAMRGKRVISGGRRSLRHVLFQAGLAAACHNPVLKAVAKRLKERGKPHKLVIVAIARRLITIANAVLKTGLPWRISPVV
ncbi:IS110 family transposase [Gluconobacter sp. NFX36]|uniref:IS110 family transposase n=1 Tax=Gluconobacter sp. NFX36 TaxID=2819535 RepID=UPI003CF587BB